LQIQVEERFSTTQVLSIQTEDRLKEIRSATHRAEEGTIQYLSDSHMTRAFSRNGKVKRCYPVVLYFEE
jgi:hypothetical protein